MMNICREFEREMAKYNLMEENLNNMDFNDDEELVDEEVAKVLMDVAGMSVQGKEFVFILIVQTSNLLE